MSKQAKKEAESGHEAHVSQRSKTSKSGTVILEEEEISGLQDDDVEVEPQ
ncbi:hypothetical protein BD311DRAFT_812022 [Dichomitus squalens]|uniref:Uncharacterized protein n=1 Tax=Dichomitus squalens TaxID=114155 RepID=A0A4Q9M4K8_9APHY|nr:hypothetical protein BD311DRAFT_812022 [Dichomitus squalens]